MSQATISHKTYPKVQVLLGSNATSHIRDTAKIIQEATAAIAKRDLKIVASSGYFRTACFPVGAGPDFVNRALGIETDLQPEVVLEICHEVENDFGRERKSRWAQRTLDIDLIAYEDRILPDRETLQAWIDLPMERQMTDAPDQLILPHPRLQDRAFALIPLSEVAPHWRHPLIGQTIAEMVGHLPEDAKNGVDRINYP